MSVDEKNKKVRLVSNGQMDSSSVLWGLHLIHTLHGGKHLCSSLYSKVLVHEDKSGVEYITQLHVSQLHVTTCI